MVQRANRNPFSPWHKIKQQHILTAYPAGGILSVHPFWWNRDKVIQRYSHDIDVTLKSLKNKAEEFPEINITLFVHNFKTTFVNPARQILHSGVPVVGN